VSAGEDDPDAPLVARMAAGDERALGELIRRHGPRLRALARRFCGNAGGADDIVQDTFWAAWRSASRWTPGEIAFKAYLTRIAVNRAIDGDRRLRLRRFFGLGAAADAVEPAPSPEGALGARDELAAVVHDIATLPAKQRAAILLSAGGERTNREIADALGLSEGAAEQLLVRARRTLRMRLTERDRKEKRE
jgi:RNA polymerase sigma-70 factor (ECF subfamily)